MTETRKCDDERRTHRITTYLSSTEYTSLHQAFEKSDIDNFSQYHRQLLINSLSHSENQINVPAVNRDVAEALTAAVHASCRLIAQLEMFYLLSEGAKLSDVQHKIDIAVRQVRLIGDICYRWAKWYRFNLEGRTVVAEIAALTLSSRELYALADSVKDAEDAS